MQSMRFNPCCSGLSHQTSVLPQEVIYYVMFQSLLQWTQSLDLFFCIHTIYGKYVSILVVVDSVIRLEQNATEKEMLILFQSLLQWTQSLDCIKARIKYIKCSVSILVVVDSVIRRKQSRLSRQHNYCFNPCCSGLSHQTQEKQLIKMFHSCFNPCCSGLSHQTRLISCIFNLLYSFQSLLQWTQSLDSKEGRSTITDGQFQSLLQWTQSLDLQDLFNTRVDLMFQSLLQWTQSLDTKHYSKNITPDVVSILVVVDSVIRLYISNADET